MVLPRAVADISSAILRILALLNRPFRYGTICMVHRPGWYPTALTVLAHLRLEPCHLWTQTRAVGVEALNLDVVAERKISDSSSIVHGLWKPLYTFGGRRRVALFLAGCNLILQQHVMRLSTSTPAQSVGLPFRVLWSPSRRAPSL